MALPSHIIWESAAAWTSTPSSRSSVALERQPAEHDAERASDAEFAGLALRPGLRACSAGCRRGQFKLTVIHACGRRSSVASRRHSAAVSHRQQRRRRQATAVTRAGPGQQPDRGSEHGRRHSHASQHRGPGHAAAATGQLASDGSLQSAFTAKDGTEKTLSRSPATDTLATLRDKINAAGAGVTAALVTDASGVRLALRSDGLGAENGFRISTVDDIDGDLIDGAWPVALRLRPARRHHRRWR